MKKKFPKTKLVKETIRHLPSRNMRDVAGGTIAQGTVRLDTDWVTSPFTP